MLLVEIKILEQPTFFLLSFFCRNLDFYELFDWYLSNTILATEHLCFWCFSYFNGLDLGIFSHRQIFR